MQEAYFPAKPHTRGLTCQRYKRGTELFSKKPPREHNSLYLSDTVVRTLIYTDTLLILRNYHASHI